jgi:hypothetical protein
VPNTIETTGFHLGYGNIYQRAPQIRTGVDFLLSQNRNVRFQPEFAFVLPFFGNTPTNVGDQNCKDVSFCNSSSTKRRALLRHS